MTPIDRLAEKIVAQLTLLDHRTGIALAVLAQISWVHPSFVILNGAVAQ